MKDKIIYEALTLFSQKGYEAVGVREISRSVGIKESSLYNHFKNKRDIFDTIIETCNARANQLFANLNLADAFKGDYQIYQNISAELLLFLVTKTFEFYLNDDYMNKFRKLLIIEQFNNESIGILYHDMFIDQPLSYQTNLFSSLMEQGLMAKGDPQAVALAFYSPIFLLLCRYDNLTDNVKTIINKHIDNFSNKYSPK